jgi:hypothetical protein
MFKEGWIDFWKKKSTQSFGANSLIIMSIQGD